MTRCALNLVPAGIVWGKLDKTFAGNFQVTYYDHHGTETSSFQLRMFHEGNHYIIEWLTNGKVEYIGAGVVFGNNLFVDWRKVTN